MKRRLFLVLFASMALTALMMVGCSNQNNIAKSVEEGDFSTIEYGSCEYLLRVSVYKGFLAHKGNCRFCKERRQKELKELVENSLKRNWAYD